MMIHGKSLEIGIAMGCPTSSSFSWKMTVNEFGISGTLTAWIGIPASTRFSLELATTEIIRSGGSTEKAVFVLDIML